MSPRALARDVAEGIYHEAMRGAFGLIERRIDWRRANPTLLSLEAEAMIAALTADPGFVAFRKLRIAHWRRVHRKHASRALAQDAVRARACGVQ